MRDFQSQNPDQQATRACPPMATRFQPGRSGNPKGRPPAAGKSIIEAINQLVADGVLEDDLRKLARSRREKPVKRIAASLLLQALEHGDMADFNDLMFGETQLDELRARGIDTAVIKRFTRRVRTKTRRDGTVEKNVSVTIELHDRSGKAFDRIMDRSVGRARRRLRAQEPDESSADPEALFRLECILRSLVLHDPNSPLHGN